MGFWSKFFRGVVLCFRKPTGKPKSVDELITDVGPPRSLSSQDLIEKTNDSFFFCATLSLSTPLSVLKRHGEEHQGPESMLPQYGTQADGIWITRTETWKELGIDIPEFDEVDDEENYAPDIGEVKSETYIPFLIEFRKIVEGDSDVEKKIRLIKTLCRSKSTYSGYAKRLRNHYGSFPDAFFYGSIMDLNDVGSKTAKALFSAGFKSQKDIENATDKDLLGVSGIGKATLLKIRGKKEAKRAGSVNKELYPEVFVAIDFETANSKRVSACSIGYAKVVCGEIVETGERLINPVGGHAAFQTSIHGITEEHTRSAATFDDLYPEISSLLTVHPIVGHSVFDKQVLNALSAHYNLNIDFRYIDNCAIAKKELPHLKNHKLKTLVKHFDLPAFKHHNAREDAIACAEIFIQLQQ